MRLPSARITPLTLSAVTSNAATAACWRRWAPPRRAARAKAMRGLVAVAVTAVGLVSELGEVVEPGSGPQRVGLLVAHQVDRDAEGALHGHIGPERADVLVARRRPGSPSWCSPTAHPGSRWRARARAGRARPWRPAKRRRSGSARCRSTCRCHPSRRSRARAPRTSVTPSSTRARAVLRPATPPPITTTSAVRGEPTGAFRRASPGSSRYRPEEPGPWRRPPPSARRGPRARGDARWTSHRRGPARSPPW